MALSKELLELWISKGFNLNGVCAFQKRYSKFYPAYIDTEGKTHEARDITFATNIDFDNENKVYKVTVGMIAEGVFLARKLDEIVIGVETLRLICKTVKELGW